jgi:hypothetical protein
MNTLQTVFEQQKRHFASGVTRSYEWRVERDFNVVANSYSKGTALITGSSTHLRRRDQRPVADDNRRLRRKAPGGFRRNREATTHEWRCRPSFQSPMLADDLMVKETA